jgi:hypothetical protein
MVVCFMIETGDVIHFYYKKKKDTTGHLLQKAHPMGIDKSDQKDLTITIIFQRVHLNR